MNRMEEAIFGHLPPQTLQALSSPDTPQAMALRWFHGDPQWQSYSIERRRQRFVLATLYFATNPPFEHNWNRPGRWLSYGSSECEWNTEDNINLCAEKDVVTNLPLAKNNMVGPLPLELSLLTSLQEVHLQGNPSLSGTIPKELCSISNLEFDCGKVCGCGQCPC